MALTDEHTTVEVDPYQDEHTHIKVTFHADIPDHPGIEGIQYRIEHHHIEGLVRATHNILGWTDCDNLDTDDLIRFAENYEPVCRFAAMLSDLGRADSTYHDIVATFLYPKEITTKILDLVRTMPLQKAIEAAHDNAAQEELI